jgi:hypothetical protein
MSGVRKYSSSAMWGYLDQVQRYVPWKDRFRCTTHDPIVSYCVANWTPEIPCELWQNLLSQYWTNKYMRAQEGWQERV